jgi:hypothetical protein
MIIKSGRMFTDARMADKALYIKLQLSVDGKKAILIQMKRDEGRDE